jgi:hypothetical protein
MAYCVYKNHLDERRVRFGVGKIKAYRLSQALQGFTTNDLIFEEKVCTQKSVDL